MTVTVIGNLILICIDLYNIIFLHFLISFNWEDILITQDSVWPTFVNTSKYVKNTSLHIVFSGNVVKHSILCFDLLKIIFMMIFLSLLGTETRLFWLLNECQNLSKVSWVSVVPTLLRGGDHITSNYDRNF